MTVRNFGLRELFAETDEEGVFTWKGPDGGVWVQAVVTDGIAGTEGRGVRVLLSANAIDSIVRVANKQK